MTVAFYFVFTTGSGFVMIPPSVTNSVCLSVCLSVPTICSNTLVRLAQINNQFVVQFLSNLKINNWSSMNNKQSSILLTGLHRGREEEDKTRGEERRRGKTGGVEEETE